MFRIIDLASVIRYVAIITTFVSIAIYEAVRRLIDTEISILKIFSIAPWAAFVIIMIITASFTSRLIWAVLSKFDPSNFPDLNGTWEGEIVTSDGLKIPARAVIRQALLQTEIDLHTETSKSVTLETTPIREKGQSKLYYTYRADPKNPAWSSYVGSTIFDVRAGTVNPSRALELSGFYFTNRKTIGRVVLSQKSRKHASDVSFY